MKFYNVLGLEKKERKINMFVLCSSIIRINISVKSKGIKIFVWLCVLFYRHDIIIDGI